MPRELERDVVTNAATATAFSVRAPTRAEVTTDLAPVTTATLPVNAGMSVRGSNLDMALRREQGQEALLRVRTPAFADARLWALWRKVRGIRRSARLPGTFYSLPSTMCAGDSEGPVKQSTGTAGHPSLLRRLVDVHAHPTDNDIDSAAVDALEMMLCAMSTNGRDQELVERLAKQRPDRIVPCFGQLSDTRS